MHQISATRRVAWLALGLTCTAILATARGLSPDPVGLGTHVQLGLPACVFWALTGWPCPTCGLTTAFAYMARMQLVPAWQAHGLGPLLFALVALAIPCALFAACARGSRASHASTRALRLAALARSDRAPRIAALTLMAALLVAWLARLVRI